MDHTVRTKALYAVFCVVLIVMAIRQAHSKPLSYQQRENDAGDATDSFKAALIDELAREISNAEDAEQSVEPTDQRAIAEDMMYDLMPPPRYGEDLIPKESKFTERKNYHLQNLNAEEDKPFNPGKRLMFADKSYDFDADKDKLFDVESLLLEESPVFRKNNQLAPKHKHVSSDKELQLSDLSLTKPKALTNAESPRYGASLYGLGKSFRGPPVRQSLAKPLHRRKKNHRNRKHSKSATHSVYKDGKPATDDTKIHKAITAKQNPVSKLIKEIESIVLPQKLKSGHGEKHQAAYGYDIGNFNHLEESKQDFMRKSPQLPLDEPLEMDISTPREGIKHDTPKKSVNMRQAAGLPLDQPRLRAEQIKERKNEINDETIGDLAELLGNQFDSEAEDPGLDGSESVLASYLLQSYLDGHVKPPVEERLHQSKQDSLSKEFEEIWKELEKEEKKKHEGHSQRVADKESSAGKTNSNMEGKSESEKTQDDINAKMDEEKKSAKDDSHASKKESNAELKADNRALTSNQSEEDSIDDDDIIKQIEERVAHLEKRWEKQDDRKAALKMKARFKM